MATCKQLSCKESVEMKNTMTTVSIKNLLKNTTVFISELIKTLSSVLFQNLLKTFILLSQNRTIQFFSSSHSVSWYSPSISASVVLLSFSQVLPSPVFVFWYILSFSSCVHITLSSTALLHLSVMFSTFSLSQYVAATHLHPRHFQFLHVWVSHRHCTEHNAI